MSTFSSLAKLVFAQAIEVYLREGGIDVAVPNPYPVRTIEHDLFRKNWIDHAQWALEDIIRDPEICPEEALRIKRRIDRSNQERTDLVELIDSFFLEKYQGIKPQGGAKINTESPAWAIDRLSILKLKIYYMGQAGANAATEEIRQKCAQKLSVLQEQEVDLCTAIDELLEDIEAGRKYMKVYKQMKMYNDPQLNPMLKGQNI
ncbi:MAG: DUF4254 domain-containing protein [Porphyromonadaceae bacterium]|nr:DUF4254 domain-containing protein [Porphyromonadaceae bacterium]